MSVSGVSSNTSLQQNLQSMQARAQKIQCEFQQLGQDLQAGNLTQAQSDFSTLNSNISTPMKTDSSLSQEFGALATALQSGNLTAAQKAYTALEQGAGQTSSSHDHHLSVNISGSGNGASGSVLAQLLGNSGSGVPSASLSGASTAYSTLAQAFQQMGLGSGASVQSLAGALSFLG